jgi:hypothetical protein
MRVPLSTLEAIGTLFTFASADSCKENLERMLIIRFGRTEAIKKFISDK